MTPPSSPVLSEEILQGFKYFRVIEPLLGHLRTARTARDRAGNRQLFYDQYASLILLYCTAQEITQTRMLVLLTLLKISVLLGSEVAILFRTHGDKRDR